MIDYHLDPATAVLTLHPKSGCRKATSSNSVKPSTRRSRSTAISSGPHPGRRQVPGWDGFGALVTHMRFVRNHEKHVKRIAVVTDSHLGDVAEHLTAFRFRGDQAFPAGEMEQACSWIAAGD